MADSSPNLLAEPTPPRLLASAHGAEVWHASWSQLAGVAEARGGCDAIICDPPFSAITHDGHEAGRLIAKRAADFGASSSHRQDTDGKARSRYEKKGRAERRAISYAAWSDVDMIRFLRRWAPMTRGWVCVLTDHVLAVVVLAELEAQGRRVFPPVPCIDPGGRARFAGDGPASNTVSLCLARPRGGGWQHWGARRGYYLTPPGYNDRGARLRERLPGAKTAWLMQSIVDDYSRPGELVCDPTCGGGTTLVAARSVGRLALGGDLDATSAQLAARYLRRPVQGVLVNARTYDKPEPAAQVGLFE